MTRPRAADDFPKIRARMHELRRESITRPRAADDFATIRARVDELRRERTEDPDGTAATADATSLRVRRRPKSVAPDR